MFRSRCSFRKANKLALVNNSKMYGRDAMRPEIMLLEKIYR